MEDLISRSEAIDAVLSIGKVNLSDGDAVVRMSAVNYVLRNLPSAQPGVDLFPDVSENYKRGYRDGLRDKPEPQIVQCKDCKYWKQQTNYQGIPLSFGFCESDEMWRSLYGETYEVAHIDTDDDFYCGYAKRRTDE